LLIVCRRRDKPAPPEVARSRRQNVARASKLVNNTSHAGTIRLCDKCGCALGAAAILLLFTWKTPLWLVVTLCAVSGATLPFELFGH
jgi:hypothetical protein